MVYCQMSEGKTVRFDKLVKESGAPEEATLWVAPEKDPDFMRAVKERRVMTVHQQHAGAKTDYGIVGFFPGNRTIYFLFPKKLSAPDKSKVIGIKYGRLASVKPKGPIIKILDKPPATKKKAHSESEKKEAEAKPPPLRKFRATLHLRFEQEVPLEVEAVSVSEAKKLLQAKAAAIEPDFKAARIARKLGQLKVLR
jgi:hypothetical protein